MKKYIIQGDSVRVSRSCSGDAVRVRRSCSRDADIIAEKASYGGSTGDFLSCQHNDKQGVGVSKQCKDESQKNQVKRKKNIRNANCDEYDEAASVSMAEKLELDEELAEKLTDNIRKRADSRFGVSTAALTHGGKEGREVNVVQKQFGRKRKRYQVKDDVELFLIAKPTPHFWKKVSRMVPGKTMQECYDKVHSSVLTPIQPRTRPRARVSNLQSPLLSAGKLLDSSVCDAKGRRYRRQKCHVIQRTVRNMLQRQSRVEQESEADLFSVLV